MALIPILRFQRFHVVSREVINSNTFEFISVAFTFLEMPYFLVITQNKKCIFILLDHLVAVVNFYCNHFCMQRKNFTFFCFYRWSWKINHENIWSVCILFCKIDHIIHIPLDWVLMLHHSTTGYNASVVTTRRSNEDRMLELNQNCCSLKFLFRIALRYEMDTFDFITWVHT